MKKIRGGGKIPKNPVFYTYSTLWQNIETKYYIGKIAKIHILKSPPQIFTIFMFENSLSKQENSFGKVWVVALVWDANGDDFGFGFTLYKCIGAVKCQHSRYGCCALL